jgi:putative acetyltransferase
MQPRYYDRYQNFIIRSWQPQDRWQAITLIGDVLQEYGLTCEPEGTDRDAVEVEHFYQEAGGAFWVVEQNQSLIGTAGYYPVSRGERARRNSQNVFATSITRTGVGSISAPQFRD